MLNLKKLFAEYGNKIQLLRDNNNNVASKVFTIPNVTIPDGTVSSPSSTDINLNDYGVHNTVWGCEVYLGAFRLPYIGDNGDVKTWVSKVSAQTITIKNTTTGWGTRAIYVLAFYSGDGV